MKKAILFLAIVFQLITFDLRADTVVGIHGFIANWRSLKPIQHCLEACGFDVCLWDYPSRRRCIEQHAGNLVSVLNQIACNSPGRPIHFVTHSTGGLVLRAALNMPGCPPEAKMGRAVMIAPPNQGSSLARRFSGFIPIQFLMGDRSGGQLMTYDPCEMTVFGNFPPSMDVLVIAGTDGNSLLFNEPNDGYITVNETRLNTPYYYKCFPCSHGALLTSSPVLCSMRTFICGWYPEPGCAGSGICLSEEE